MAVVDALHFNILEANDSLSNMTGYSPNELVHKHLSFLAADREKFFEATLLAQTGVRDLGIWQQMRWDNTFINVKICAQPVRDRKAFLLSFTNVTDQLSNRKELEEYRLRIHAQVSEELHVLKRSNEELAYRASQTEHVNAELIAVNEQLQHVNKKLASKAEDALWRNTQLNLLMENFLVVSWSFNLSGKGRHYVSPTAELLFEEPFENLKALWFWLDYVHPEDVAIQELCQRQLLETGQSTAVYRIITRKGSIKSILYRLKTTQDAKGVSLIVGYAADVSETKYDMKKMSGLGADQI
jgi:PAS domain S-box-containing protein